MRDAEKDLAAQPEDEMTANATPELVSKLVPTDRYSPPPEDAVNAEQASDPGDFIPSTNSNEQ